jgi:hypothetical protein
MTTYAVYDLRHGQWLRLSRSTDDAARAARWFLNCTGCPIHKSAIPDMAETLEAGGAFEHPGKAGEPRVLVTARDNVPAFNDQLRADVLAAIRSVAS